MNYSDLKDDLIRDEGLKLHPYLDSVGKMTIGVGRNLDDVGITKDEAMMLLSADIEGIEADIRRNLDWYDSLPANAQRGLINMGFNLGWPRLSKFQKMLDALCKENWDCAADEALNSRWAAQVGDRAVRIANLFRSCLRHA